MRICFCIPHYFQEVLENKGNRYASQKIIKRKEKILSLTEVISNIHLLFGEIHIGANHRLRVFEPVHNECANDVDVFVITDKENHLLDDLKINNSLYKHIQYCGDPEELGFHAHNVFKSNSEQYDYFCYLEDDIIIKDSYFFKKLNYFNNQLNNNLNCLLQPNRYEQFYKNGNIHHQDIHKLYTELEYTEKVSDIKITMNYLGSEVEFEQSRAHHSGCFFVNRIQLQRLMQVSHFGDSSGIDNNMKLDAAATTAIAEAFQIYKTTRNNMNYFTVEHAVPNMYEQIEINQNGDVLWNHPWS